MELVSFKSMNPIKIENYNDYLCFDVNHFGTLNGYVLIKPDQKGFKGVDDYTWSSIDVHGGITFDKQMLEGRVIGFDTNHFGDYMPSIENHFYNSIHGRKWKENDIFEELYGVVDQLIKNEYY